MFRSFLAATALLAGLAQAGLSDMRATIPGSLHQCQNISVFFFDTDDTGDKTLLLVPAADAATLGDGTVTLDDALSKVQPLQQISNINSADAASFPFFLKIEQDVAFSTFGFLSNGQGKNMDLDRSVMAPLPDALDCLTQVIAPATTSTTVPVVPKTSSSSTSSKTPSSSSPPAASTSGFVKALKASSSSKTSAIATTPPPASSVVPASAAPAPVSASSTSSAANSTAKAPVIEAAYLLSSFISISAEQTTDGLVSSAAITGGHVTGNYNGTILAVGSALFTPNNTLPADATTTNATGVDAGADTNPPILLSATYTFTIDDGLYAGDAVFVMGQTPLSPNTTVPALLMHLQPGSAGLGMKWANKTVLGKPSYINTTMFRIDAYVV